MKPRHYGKYGTFDVLSFREITMPKLASGRVNATSSKPLDWRHMQADPLVFRLSVVIGRPKLNSLGADLSEVVGSVTKAIEYVATKWVRGKAVANIAEKDSPCCV